MFSILALVLSLFGADPAAAQGCGQQNPNCIVPTAPVGTSNNQAASTEFVQQAIPAAGQPLTKADDTNVTVTLGGTPATALLQPTSITMGWAGTLSVSRGGLGIGSGTSGGIPYYSGSTTIASSGVLSASNPVIGGGAGVAPSSGTRSGNTTVFGTTSGTLTSQNCVKFDASGNLVAQGTACVNGAVASFFADPSTGNDSNDCLAASAGGGHGPCLTLQRVVSVAITYDAGNVRPIINLAAGTFTSGATVAGALRGEATPTANPPGLSIVGAGSGSTTIDDTPLCGTLIASNHANVILSNLTIQHSGAGGCGGQGSAIFAEGLAFVALGADVKFGPTQGQHMHAEGGALIEITANYSIGGSAANHMAASTSGKIFNDGHVVTCTGAFAYTTFILAQSNSTILFLPGATFSGCGGTTGVKFQLVGGAILDAGGVSGLLATIPGSNNGQVDDSSRYSNPEPLATLGTCTSGSLNANSTDWKMLVTFGVAPGASCAINFAYSKPVAPVCVATTSAVGAVTLSVSTTQVVVTQAFVNGESLYVICRPLSWM